MRWKALLLVLVGMALPARAEDLEGSISGGKAKALVDAARPDYEAADRLYRSWILGEIPEPDLLPTLRKAVALYDAALGKLAEALEIQYDAAINHLVRLGARRVASLRFRTEFQKPKPEATEPPATAPEPPPTPAPTREETEEAAAPDVAFAADAPPALPVDVALPLPAAEEAPSRKDIEAFLRDYYDSRRQERLLYRHTLCGGKGTLRGGATCEECSGSGVRINLFHFRRAFWGCFSPLLRDAPGALDALRRFHARAQKDPAALGDLVKAFRIVSVEAHGYWARATVLETTTAGKSERSFTLISVGSRWFFYHPAADAELVPKWGKE